MSWVQETSAAIHAAEPGIKLHLDWRAQELTAVIAMLRVPENRRGQGVARRVVTTVVEAADLAGARLAATPTAEFGADLQRLRRFYESFGFIRNAGPDRDWSCKEDYIRPLGARRQDA